MREDKLFNAVKWVDDDLICEMTEYSPKLKHDSDSPGGYDVSEGVLYYVPEGRRTRRLWKYPVTAAVVLAAAGGALFAVNYSGGILGNLGTVTGGEAAVTDAETDNEDVCETADTVDMSSEETQPPVSEAAAPVVPLKVVFRNEEYKFNDLAVIYVDSYPEIPKPDCGEEFFTEMSTEELWEYYGFYRLSFPYWIDDNQIIEITDENTRHGIYTLPDGSVYDINTFTFELAEDRKNEISAHKFTVTMGKHSKFGQEYHEYYKTNDMPLGSRGTSAFYNEDMDTVFSILEFFGGTIMFSSTPDEITSNFFGNDSEMLEKYEKWYGPEMPGYFEMLITLVINSCSANNDNYYVDRDKGLWYSKKDDSYLDENTFEWIPAEQWDFDE